MLVSGTPESLLFAEPQAFVAAKALVGQQNIRQHPRPSVTYIHCMFDNHEVVFANGAATESLLARPEAANALPASSHREIETLFPDLKTQAPLSARLCIPVNQSVSLF